VATTQVKESGKINLNTASAGELTALKGIGEKKAQAIIDHREKQGKFTPSINWRTSVASDLPRWKQTGT
jgi:competence ComEA-like helix-hairpin-helix protein